MDGNQSDDKKMARTAAHDLTIALRASFDIAPLTWFVSLRQIEGKPDPPAHDSASSQPAVDFHAELKRNLHHVTAEPGLELCDPQCLNFSMIWRTTRTSS